MRNHNFTMSVLERYVNGLNTLSRTREYKDPFVCAMWQRVENWQDYLEKIPITQYKDTLALVKDPLSDYNTRVTAINREQAQICIERIKRDGKGAFVAAFHPWISPAKNALERDMRVSFGLNEKNGYYIYRIDYDEFVEENLSYEDWVQKLN